jgi:hypothetical protein
LAEHVYVNKSVSKSERKKIPFGHSILESNATCVAALDCNLEKPKRNVPMTALAHIQSLAPLAKASDATSVETGAGVEMFTSGSAPSATDMMAGDGLELFTTSVLGASAEASDGDKTGLFTSSG